MNLKDLIKNSGIYQRIVNGNAPAIPVMQYDDNGNVNYDASLRVQQQTTPLTPAERFFGRNMTMDEQRINPEGETELVTHSNYRPGLLEDISAGYKENRTTPISLNNFGQNKGKGAAFRIGEALGSIARFGASPVGRGLLMAGIVGATGGGALPALAFGGMAGVGNQGYRMRDAMYRNQLKDNALASLRNSNDWDTLSTDEQNARIKAATDEIDNVRGYLDNDVYSNIVRAQQLKDNAEYRNALLLSQQQAQQEAREDRKLQREMQAQQNKFNNYIQGQRIAQGWATLNDRQRAREEARIAKNNADTYGDIQAQLDNFAKTFKTVNNPYRYRVFGGASEALNTLSNEEANFNAQRTLLFNQIARKLGGEKGVLSDKDIARVEAALPKLTDTYEQKMAKMEAVYDLLDIKRSSANQAVNNMNTANSYDNDPLGIL